MKRTISLILVALLVAALFVGCSKSDPVGTYKIDMDSLVEAMKDSDEAKDMSDDQIKSLMKTIGITEDSMSLEIKKDGTFVLDLSGDKTEGTWKQNGSKLTLTVENEPIDADFSDGKITMESEEIGMKLVFVKK